MRIFAIATAVTLTVVMTCCGGGFVAFVLWSNYVQEQCAEAGRRQGVVATYNVHNGCTARGIFGIRVPIDMEP